MEDIITGTYDNSAVAQNGIFNNISQLWNHNQFWEMMGPGVGSKMPSELESRDHRQLWLGRCSSNRSSLPLGCGSVRLWLVLVGEKRRWLTGRDQDRKRCEPTLLWPDRACWAAMCGSILTTSTSATNGPAYLTNFLDNLVNWENVASRM